MQQLRMNDTVQSSCQVTLPERYTKLEIVNVDLLSHSYGIQRSTGVRIVCFYIPPNFRNEINSCKLLVCALSHLCKTNLPLCIVGDFNLPEINWSTNTCREGSTNYLFLCYFY